VSVRNGDKFVPLEFERLAPEKRVKRAREFDMRMQTRRTVRQSSSQPVERELIESALRVASRPRLAQINNPGGLLRFPHGTLSVRFD
jgi:hypothetical protein